MLKKDEKDDISHSKLTIGTHYSEFVHPNMESNVSTGLVGIGFLPKDKGPGAKKAHQPETGNIIEEANIRNQRTCSYYFNKFDD